jgi:hypothetical protein
MSDSKLAMIFFEVGLALTLISMVLGPFDITEWAIAVALIACFAALGGMYLAFCSWDEPDEEPKEELEQHVNHTGSGTSE